MEFVISIPKDILKIIIKESKNLKSLRLSCKFFMNFCDQNISKMCVNIGTDEDQKWNRMQTMTKFSEYAKQVVIKKPIEIILENIPNPRENLLLLLEHNPNIVKLISFNSTLNFPFELLPLTLEKLETVYINPNSISNLPTSITSLSLGATSISETTIFPPKLKSLSLRKRTILSEKVNFPSSLTKLKIMDTISSQLLIFPTTLRKLEIMMAPKLKDIKQVKLPLLEKLTLSEVGITDESVHDLPSSLTDLSLGLIKVSNKFFNHLPSSLRKLSLSVLPIDLSEVLPNLPPLLSSLIIQRCKVTKPAKYPEYLRYLELVEVLPSLSEWNKFPSTIRELTINRTNASAEDFLCISRSVKKLSIRVEKKVIKEVIETFRKEKRSTVVVYF